MGELAIWGKVRRMKKNSAKAAIIVGSILILYLVTLKFQLWLESTSRSDSFGLWYTILCSVTYTVSVVLAIFLLVLFVKKRKST
jgi:hypothetical protein